MKIDQRAVSLALARKNLFEYAHLRAPDFYKLDRKYLIKLCDGIQSFLSSDDNVLVICAPPRHGKSRTAQLAVEWLLGRDHSIKIMTGSYNETLATQFSKSVRNSIQEIKADPERLIYSDIFPGTEIKKGDGAMNLWSLADGHQNYLATAPKATATGFGADIIIIDDLIKSAMEANTAHLLEDHWRWFTDTMLSRLEEGGRVIIIMTRWHSKDLAGKAMQKLPEQGWRVRSLIFKAQDDQGDMLCDEILSRTSYERKKRTMGRDIASANYQQEPIDLVGRLYSSFSTYEDIPRDGSGSPLFHAVKAYTDTADTGSDYLCSIIYGVYQKEAYVLDVYYTKDPMEITEKEVASRLTEHEVNVADIESNNGGRAFARAVERHLESYPQARTSVRWFHQSKNKEARILSNAPWVMEHIHFPVDWITRWPEYYEAMFEYQREGKNAHDDAPDATTGVAERASKEKPGMRILQ